MHDHACCPGDLSRNVGQAFGTRAAVEAMPVRNRATSAHCLHCIMFVLGTIQTSLNVTAALAQTPAEFGGSTDPNVERAEPQDPRSTGSICPGQSLSQRLDRCGGVIRPPRDIAPDNAIRPPDTGTMPVIPPPGSPDGDPRIEPKG